MVTMVTGKRQVTVPADIARELGIEVGSQIDWEADHRNMTVTLHVKPSKRQLLQRLSEIGRKYSGKGEDSGVILERMRDAEESERMAELGSFSGKNAGYTTADARKGSK